MDFIIELILELLLEGSIELGTSKKISKYIRYPILILLLLFYLAIIGLVLFVGISALSESLIGGIILIVLNVFLVAATILGFRKKLKEKRKD